MQTRRQSWAQHPGPDHRPFPCIAASVQVFQDQQRGAGAGASGGGGAGGHRGRHRPCRLCAAAQQRCAASRDAVTSCLWQGERHARRCAALAQMRCIGAKAAPELLPFSALLALHRSIKSMPKCCRGACPWSGALAPCCACPETTAFLPPAPLTRIPQHSPPTRHQATSYMAQWTASLSSPRTCRWALWPSSW